MDIRAFTDMEHSRNRQREMPKAISNEKVEDGQVVK